MSRIGSPPYSLSNTVWEDLLGLALCGGRGMRARQKGERGAEQDEEAAPAQLDMTQPMLKCLGGTSPLR